jgi:hypothetical protein
MSRWLCGIDCMRSGREGEGEGREGGGERNNPSSKPLDKHITVKTTRQAHTNQSTLHARSYGKKLCLLLQDLFSLCSRLGTGTQFKKKYFCFGTFRCFAPRKPYSSQQATIVANLPQSRLIGHHYPTTDPLHVHTKGQGGRKVGRGQCSVCLQFW